MKPATAMYKSTVLLIPNTLAKKNSCVTVLISNLVITTCEKYLNTV